MTLIAAQRATASFGGSGHLKVGYSLADRPDQNMTMIKEPTRVSLPPPCGVRRAG
jgi:hypothetical protein